MRKNQNPFIIATNVKVKRSLKVQRASSHEWQPEEMQERILSQPLHTKRFVSITLLCAAIFMALFIRVFSLQSRAEIYGEKSEQNRTRHISQVAPRGIIYDREGIPLTVNAADVGIFISIDDFPKIASEEESILSHISTITHTPLEDIRARMLEIKKIHSLEPTSLVDHITHEQAIQLSVESEKLPGVRILPKILREYPNAPIFSHILGYTGKMTSEEWETLKNDDAYRYNDGIGKSGLEKSYETTLKGKNGIQKVEVNAFGHISKVISSTKPEPGENITLSIDAGLQTLLYQKLESTANDLGVPGGAAVAIDPRSGEILALVSFPGYDSNEFSKGIAQSTYQDLINDLRLPLFNRTISGEYPSGSTIKPLIAAAALSENLINQRTTVNSTGGIRIGEWFFPDWKSGGHGSTNVTKAIAESVNTFFYAVGGGLDEIQGLGVDRIRTYAEKFGLNAKLGIDIDGERQGFIPTKEWKEETKGERWYIGDTYHLSIGQGDLLVTPLQVASYTATISNGGTLFTPHLVHAVGDQPVEPVVKSSGIVDDAYLKIVREGMRQTVLGGSARSLQSVPIPIAGKTGTAEFGAQGKTHAWFTGFAPYDNPEIALVIMVEAGGEGSSTAVPIAKEAFTWWAEHRQ